MKTISKLEQLVEAYGFEWDEFKDSLDEMDRDAFISLLRHAKMHAEAGSKVESPDLFESVVMSILVEHQKELQQLQGRLLQPQTKACPGAEEQARLRRSSKEIPLVTALRSCVRTAAKHSFTYRHTMLKRFNG